MKVDESLDMRFKKYINEEPIVPDGQIQNIQSIQFETKNSYCAEENVANDNLPNSSFEVKLIHSELNKHDDNRNIRS